MKGITLNNQELEYFELLVQELQNRIGQLTSNYESQLAAVKVQAHVKIKELEDQISSLTKVESEPDGK